jgi:CheY-like chemotaxis protein
MHRSGTLIILLTFDIRSASISPWIYCRSGINDYMAINYNYQAHRLSSFLPKRDPYSIRSLLPSDDFVKNMRMQASPNGRPNITHSPTIPSATSNKRILIVDDDHDIARFFKLALDRAGFITEVSNSPLSALTNFKKGAYDLLLLDINMPHMTGFELYRKISKIDGEVKVCFITAFEEYYSEFKSEFPNLNEVECYIKKPVGMDYLINAVKSRLDCN